MSLINPLTDDDTDTIGFPAAQIQILIQLCKLADKDPAIGALAGRVAVELAQNPHRSEAIVKQVAATFALGLKSYIPQLPQGDRATADQITDAIFKIAGGKTAGNGTKVIITQT